MMALITSNCGLNQRAAAATARAAGNEHFKQGGWAEALERYTAAAVLDELEPTVELNKAAALLKLGRFEEAVLAADRALLLSGERLLSMSHTWTVVQHDGPNHLGL